MNKSIPKKQLLPFIQKTKEAAEVAGYSLNALRHYHRDGFLPISDLFRRENEENFSQTLLDSFVTEKITLYDKKIISRSCYQNARKASFLLSEYCETGEISWKYIPSRRHRGLTPVFYEILELFSQEKVADGTLQVSTMKTYRSAIRQFLFILETKGIHDFTHLSFEIVNESATDFAKHFPAGTKSSIPAVRLFLKYLQEKNLIHQALHQALPEYSATRRRIRQGFSCEEIDQILSFPDTNTPIGKRDFAIFMLATQTGLRSVDLAYLEFSSIHWDTFEIHITQHKTGKSLTLPLEIESANALADYILHARPDFDSPIIFLCQLPPYRGLHPRSLSSVLSRYLRRNELENSLTPRRGMHSLRRAFGARLLSSEIPLEVLSELLGHSSVDSTKPYVATDETGLRQCGLPLLGIEVQGGAMV